MALTKLLIYNYNNYFNRKVKKETSLSSYGTPIYTVNKANFNHFDGVSANHVIGTSDYSGEGDYLIEVDSEDNILSRWFILDANQIRKGQYRLDLRRDVIVEKYDAVTTGTSFILSGFVDRSSKLIFNSENIQLNQIKQSQETLTDESGVAWVVGYVSKSLGAKTITYSKQDGNYDIYQGTIASTAWPYYQYQNTNYPVTQEKRLKMGMAIWGDLVLPRHWSINLSNQSYTFIGNSSGYTNELSIDLRGTDWRSRYDDTINKIWDFYNANDVNSVLSTATTFPTNSYYNLAQYDNKIIQFSDGRFRCQVRFVTASTITESLTGTSLIDGIYNGYNAWAPGRVSKSNFNTFTGEAVVYNYRIILTKLQENNITLSLPSTKYVTTDSAYDMFAIPFDRTIIYNDAGTVNFNSLDKEDIMGIVNAITSGLSASELYDIQLLPYCPIPKAAKLKHSGLYAYDGVKIDELGTEDVGYSYIKDSSSNNVGIVLFPKLSSFETRIYHYMNAWGALEKTIDFKLNDICNMYRLVGGNHASAFEFNPTRTGEITYFRVSATYIPYQPYVRVFPEAENVFGGYLYGPWMKDSRGLILSGDFSLSQINDAWTDYQIQNKNYNNIFNRQIQNMEINRGIQKQSEWAQLLTGSLQGASTGALAGGSVGGAYGAVAGAIGGGLGSAGAGAIDIMNSEKLYQEQVSLAKDTFSYQLGNIQALPNTLDKVSSYNIDNLVFPIIEYYTCSEEERELTRNKLIYNGFSLGVVDCINKYITPDDNSFVNGVFVKAQPIKLDIDDNHMSEAIEKELLKGVYF